MIVTKESVFRKNPDVVFRKIGDEYVLVPLSNSIADISSIFNLNDTGAFVWERLDGKAKLGDIVEELKAAFQDEERHESDVMKFVAEMLEAKLLEA